VLVSSLPGALKALVLVSFTGLKRSSKYVKQLTIAEIPSTIDNDMTLCKAEQTVRDLSAQSRRSD